MLFQTIVKLHFYCWNFMGNCFFIIRLWQLLIDLMQEHALSTHTTKLMLLHHLVVSNNLDLEKIWVSLFVILTDQEVSVNVCTFPQQDRCSVRVWVWLNNACLKTIKSYYVKSNFKPLSSSKDIWFDDVFMYREEFSIVNNIRRRSNATHLTLLLKSVKILLNWDPFVA